jgi:hypothetical protein
VTRRSRSACIISSCPSCIPKAWGCQDDISTLLKGDIITLLPQIFCGIFLWVYVVFVSRQSEDGLPQF